MFGSDCFLILIVIGERFKSWSKGLKLEVEGFVFWGVGNYGYLGDEFNKLELGGDN